LLLRGETKSCGCLIHESKLKGVQKYINTYKIINNDTAIIYTKKQAEILVDTKNLSQLLKYTWMADKYRTYPYAFINNKLILMHRFILNVVDNPQVTVDHINRNPLDNRETNLRPCNNLINSHNISTHKNNTSGVSGVHYRKDTHKWTVRIGNKYNRVYIGQFDTFEEAVLERYRAEIKYDYLNPNNFLLKEVRK